MNASQARNRKALLVAGMHRSGTSALTRVLNLLGAEIGDRLLPARTDNPRGYWEDEAAVASNEALLRALDLSWQSPGPLPNGWMTLPSTTQWCQRLRLLLDERFSDKPLFMIKDPRISRLLPAWNLALMGMSVVPHVLICIRHPLEVAESLRARAGMPRALALALWLAYTLDAERDSRAMARWFVRYDQLLDDWSDTVKGIQDQFDLPLPRADNESAALINSFLDPDLRHHNASAAGDRSETDLARLATQAYDLALQENNGNVASAQWNALANTLNESMQMLDQAQTPMVKQDEPEKEHGVKLPQVDEWTAMELMSEVIEARLYYRRSDAQASESAKIAKVASTHDYPMHVEFDLPEHANAEFIRFDPASMPGIYRLHGIRVNGRDVHAGELRVSAVRERRLATRDGHLFRFFCSDDDPYVELDIRGLHLGADALHIEILFDRDTPLEEMDRRLEHALNRLDQDHAALGKAQAATEASLRAELELRLREVERNTSALERRINAQSRFELLLSDRNAVGPPHRAATGRPGWLRASALPIRHTAQLRFHARNPRSGGDWWSSDEEDPSMVLGTPARGLAPGWYFLSMDFAILDGSKASAPALYIDYGKGFSEANRITLAVSHGSIRQRLLLNFPQTVHGLRFDPHEGPGEFLISPLRLRRASWPETMARLTLPAVRRMRSQGATLSQIARAMWTEMAKGPHKALTALHVNSRIAANAFDRVSYADWIARHDTLTHEELHAMQRRARSMSKPPRISIVMPVYNTPAKLLRECIDSVKAQIYPHWELCIANDASPEPQVREILDQQVKSDSRIKVVHRDTNGHISEASNSALELASGDWIALLDHDDLLPPHALLHVAEAIASSPGAQLIYSDEDKLDANGKRYDPYFKPDWNPELFLCQNFVSHLGVYRADLIRDAGGFRKGLEGSQDHDLALRCIERIDAADIIHIPKVLYHWRATPGSTAKATSEKKYAIDAGLAAVTDHLERSGHKDAKVTRSIGGYYRVQFPVPVPAPKVSLIIPTRDRVDLLRVSVGSILERTDYANLELIIVDNQSVEPETGLWFDEIAARDSRVTILHHDDTFNFSRINNLAVAAATGDIVGLINNDIEVIHPDWLTEMVSHAAREGVGAVGAKLYYQDGSIQHAGVVLGSGGVAAHAYAGKPHGHTGQMGRAMLVQNVSAVTAACLLVKKSAWMEVGGMNEELEVAFNDVDFCLRLLNAGYRNVWTPHAELVHHESASRGYEDTPEKKARFNAEVARIQSIWGEKLRRDPAYHPNALLLSDIFNLDVACHGQPRASTADHY